MWMSDASVEWSVECLICARDPNNDIMILGKLNINRS